MLRLASAQRSNVWCQIGLCSLHTPAYVHDGSFDTYEDERLRQWRRPVSPPPRKTWFTLITTSRTFAFWRGPNLTMAILRSATVRIRRTSAFSIAPEAVLLNRHFQSPPILL